MITQEQIDNWFTYQAPTGEQVDAYRCIRACAKELAKAILIMTPATVDQSEAISLLRKVVMIANQAIACGNPPDA